MKLKEMIKKLNIMKKTTTIYVSSEVYDEVHKIIEHMGMDYHLRYGEPRTLGDKIIIWYEIDIRCGIDEYKDFHRYLQAADLRGDMGFPGYGVCCV